MTASHLHLHSTTPDIDYHASAATLSQSTAVRQSLPAMCRMFDGLYRRRAFVQSFTSLGMDMSEFDDAYYNTDVLVSEYGHYEGESDRGDDENEDEE